MLSFTQRTLQTKFQEWLHSPIFIGSGTETAIRKYVLKTFIEELRIFLSSRGYSLKVSDTELIVNWARFLFRLQKSLSLPKWKLNPDATPEDFDMYNFVLDDDTWKLFFEEWKDMQDFTIDAQAYLIPFTWQYIDINNSSVTKTVDDIINGSDSDEEYAGRARQNHLIDPYLADQGQSSFKYGRWD